MPLSQHLPIVQNWLAKNAGQPVLGIYEFPLYTDVRVTGEINRVDWPYAFLNTIPMYVRPGIVQAPIILRTAIHLEAERPDFSKTNSSLYHGGELPDEIAALVSLCLGVRMRAGGQSRRFDEMFPDVLGHPVGWDRKSIPTLSVREDRLILPDVVMSPSLDELNRLESLVHFTSAQEIALIRAARLYQDALWVVESDPALAWLMLVSSVETAANQWRSEKGSLIDRFVCAKPDLANLLKESGGDNLVGLVARHIEPTLGATKKFVDFTLQFLPPPPDIRPSEGCQVKWDSSSMKRILGILYGYRSNALHGGIPFPAPMCEAAFRTENPEVFSEKGTIGLAASTQGGVWMAQDLPISLHTFNYIVRGSLLKWWKSMGNT